MKAAPRIRYPRAQSMSHPTTELCRLYGFPTRVKVAPQTIAVGELGGAPPTAAEVDAWARALGLPAPTIQVHKLPGADTSSSDADGEVALDWQVAAAAWSYMTGLPATVLLVYGPNSDQAFVDAVDYAAGLPDVGAFSWSWGAPEDQWSPAARSALAARVESAPFATTAASGDNDADDGESHPVVDCPACLPAVVGCGGTTFTGSAESVWNDGTSGTGGGFSQAVARPAWQPANPQGSGRMVPDVAGSADPGYGYPVYVGGRWQIIGGTSAVAPLVAALLAVANGARQAAGLPRLDGRTANAALWASPASFFDVTSGGNGAYHAAVGPDPCTGLGRPVGDRLLAALTAGAPPQPPALPPPPPSAPPGPPTQPPSPPLLGELMKSLSWIVAELKLLFRELGPAGLPLIEQWLGTLGLSPLELSIVKAVLEKLVGAARGNALTARDAGVVPDFPALLAAVQSDIAPVQQAQQAAAALPSLQSKLKDDVAALQAALSPLLPAA